MELWIKGTAGTTGDCLYPIWNGPCGHSSPRGTVPPSLTRTRWWQAYILSLCRSSVQTPKGCSWVHGVPQRSKKPSYLVWLAQGTLDKGCSWYGIGGPTGSGKTLVAAVQCSRELSGFFCSRGTCNGKLHFQVQRYHL